MASRTQELAAVITENLVKVQKFLTANNLPDISIERDVPLQFQFNPAFVAPRDDAIVACKELLAMLSGSFGTLVAQPPTEWANTQAVCRLKIASSFPADRDTATYEELSQKCELPEAEVRRIIRALLPAYIFQETKDGRVAHTAASRLLATNPLMSQWIDMTASEIIPAAMRLTDAMQKWPGSEEPNQVGYSIANDTDDHAFTYMAKHAGRSQRFAAAMSLFSNTPANSPKWLLENYPWGGIDTVVDVGGSTGKYSIPIAQAFPNLNCIIQDLPEVIAEIESSALGGLPNVSFMAHDFFVEQPVKGADVYLLRWILHDWSDKYAIRILQALIPALKTGSKIVVHEHIVPQPGEAPLLQERTLRAFDTNMRALTNGKEREVRDWEALLAAADPRFRIEKMATPHGSALGIIEIAWAP